MSLGDVVSRVEQELSRRVSRSKYEVDPVLWAKEYLGIELWQKQREIIESIRDNRNTAVAAGHGVGKTYVASVAVAWWIDTHPPEETFVASTAPSVDQVNLLWDNLRRLHGLAQRRYNEGLIDHPLPGEILGDNKWKLPDGSLLGQGRKPPDNKSDVAFQGRHANFLMAIGDEAVGLSPGYLEALGNIATAATNRQLLLANPTDPSCAMAKLWDEKITGWHRMHISVFDSPAVKEDPEFDISKAPALSGWDYINEKKEEWGEDDPRYIARVLGEWAFDAGDLVFSAAELESARSTFVLPDPDALPEHGWDISGDGVDFTVGYECLRGEVWETDDTGKPVKATGRQGYRIRRVDKWNKTPLVGTNPNSPGTATKIDQWAGSRGAYLVKIDAAGLGKGVYDGLIDLGATNRYLLAGVYGSTPSQDPREYINIRVETFFKLKEDMNKGRLDLDPKDDVLIEQLSGVQYEHSPRGGLKIESKQEIRKKGRKSPDDADACWYARYEIPGLNDVPVGTVLTQDPADIPDYGFMQYVRGAGQPILG